MEQEMLMASMAPIHYTNTTLDLDQTTLSDLEMEFYGIEGYEFSCSLGSPETLRGVSSNSSDDSTMFVDGIFDMENLDGFFVQDSSHMEGLVRNSSSPAEYDNIYGMMNESKSITTMEEGDRSSPCFSLDSNKNSIEFPHQDTSPLLFPGQDAEVDKQMILTHLLKAYGEAQENMENCLMEILIKSITEKSDPLGNTLERVAYHLFNNYMEDRDEYLKQELGKNFLQALGVLYGTLLESRLAHFTANSVILESPPHDTTTVHIIDFDMGQGIQWPPLIEAFSFVDAKKQLLSHARQFGVNLQIAAKSLEEFAGDLTRAKKRGRSEWLAFNCMVGLPHMGHRRSNSQVMDFLRVAKESLISFPGVLTLGEGDTRDSYYNNFDSLVRRWQARFESLERNFPAYLVEARTAMEILFLAPSMSLDGGWRKDCALEAESLFEGRQLSHESIAEAKLMVIGGDHLYEVDDKERDNQIVLRWNGVPLVKLSSWRCQ